MAPSGWNRAGVDAYLNGLSFKHAKRAVIIEVTLLIRITSIDMVLQDLHCRAADIAQPLLMQYLSLLLHDCRCRCC